MSAGERTLADHLGVLFAPSDTAGSLNLDTMTMHLPDGWQADPGLLLVRAHELTHLRLTYSTGLGILLDLLGGLSRVKLMNVLRTKPRGSVLFPLERNLDGRARVDDKTRGHLAYCLACEMTVRAGAENWRYLQEAVATFVMLELAPTAVEAHGFARSQVAAEGDRLVSRLAASSPYLLGLTECRGAASVLGKEWIFPAAIVASEPSLYSLKIFTRLHRDEFSGATLLEEANRLSDFLGSEPGNPTLRFRRLVERARQSGSILKERKLTEFNTLAVPDVLHDEDWLQKTDEWIRGVIGLFSGFDERQASRALSFYHAVVEKGWPPTIQVAGETGGLGVVRGQEDVGLLRYVLGSLRRATQLRSGTLDVVLPENWDAYGTAQWISHFLQVADKHSLPVRVTLV